MKRILFDLETDGLLDEVTQVHVMVLLDLDTRERMVFNNQGGLRRTIAQGLWFLEQADLVVAHNGTAYDCAVLEKLYGIVIPWQRQRDTMVLARLLWPDIKRMDLERKKKLSGKDFPGQLIGRHSLEAWGHRLGQHKGEYVGDPLLVQRLMGNSQHPGLTKEGAQKEAYARRWECWNQAMEDYCIGDIATSEKLWDRICKENYSEQAILLETQVAHIVARQERHGFLFDEPAAAGLYARLVQRRHELEAEVRAVFKPRFRSDGEFLPKRADKARGYEPGAPLTKLKLTEFSPSSREHCAEWLKAYYGWEPTEFTADGRPKVDEEVISKLPYAEAAPLKEYFMVGKRIGQLGEGKEAWLRHVKKDGRIHGSHNTNGAVTGRMTHSRPNMGQVPAVRSPYGTECRALFKAAPGYVLVGADADALELRDLAGYMAAYDGGAYIKTVLEGKKADGTDMHSVNCRALGMDPKELQWNGQPGRDVAKTWFYGFIYGAGDEKAGTILTGKKGADAMKKGKASKAAFLRNLPAMGKLVEQVKAAASKRGFLYGLDKRLLHVRSAHAALNTLLQSAGAVQMKTALCLFDDSLQQAGLIPGTDYEFVANVHDEWQLEVRDGLQETVGPLAVESIRRAGVALGFRCPLDGEWKCGANWAETH